MQIVIC